MDAGRRDELERKVYAGERLDREDGLALAGSDDLVWLGRLAHRRRGGPDDDRALFLLGRNLDLADIDEAGRAVQRASAAIGEQPTELRLRDVVRPTLPWAHYPRTLRELKAALPAATVRAFTAADIVALEQVTGRPADQLLAELIDAGLDSLADDGPEVGDPADERAWDEWSRIHRLAHGGDLSTSAVIVYGGSDDVPQRIDHLLRLRDLQEATGGFVSLTPLRRQPDAAAPRTGPAGADALRMFALARLLVDNIPHLTCDWPSDGRSIAQLALNFGVDDLAGAPAEPVDQPAVEQPANEQPAAVQPAAVHGSAVAALRDDLVELIGDAGFRPVERDTRYHVLREFDAPPSLAERRSEPQQVWA